MPDNYAMGRPSSVVITFDDGTEMEALECYNAKIEVRQDTFRHSTLDGRMLRVRGGPIETTLTVEVGELWVRQEPGVALVRAHVEQEAQASRVRLIRFLKGR